jgi:hypothetical protein
MPAAASEAAPDDPPSSGAPEPLLVPEACPDPDVPLDPDPVPEPKKNPDPAPLAPDGVPDSDVPLDPDAVPDAAAPLDPDVLSPLDGFAPGPAGGIVFPSPPPAVITLTQLMPASGADAVAGGVLLPQPEIMPGAIGTNVPKSATSARWTFDKRPDIETSQSRLATIAREISRRGDKLCAIPTPQARSFAVQKSVLLDGCHPG